MVGAQFGLVQLERRFEECDRLRQPAGAIVGDGLVVAGKERLGVIGAQPGVEQLDLADSKSAIASVVRPLAE